MQYYLISFYIANLYLIWYLYFGYVSYFCLLCMYILCILVLLILFHFNSFFESFLTDSNSSIRQILVFEENTKDSYARFFVSLLCQTSP